MVPPHNPERAKLVAQINNLQRRLALLDGADTSPLPPASPAASTPDESRAGSPALTGKRARKAQAVTGPLPPSLANAPKRHIALLFSYEGWAHSGLAYQPKGVYTPFPTVEGCILDALEKARLIEPITETEGFGCGFERCGRTDAGVSSSAQVINLWVRSDLEDPMKLNGRELDPDSVEGRRHARSRSPTHSRSSSVSSSSSDLSFDSGKRKPASDVELPYITLINRHLPPSIRIHAWSPVSANFSSRFSCIWRHYKYFFSSSPVSPFLASKFDFGAAYIAAGALPEHAAAWQERLQNVDWAGLSLDVDLMRNAVARLVGEHDFRNFCKVDPPKQLSVHVRTVNSATIDPVEGEGDDMFVLNLRGGAFLYNQVRHIVAILFLVGARLEPPSIVDKLLWTSDRTAQTVEMHTPGSDEPEREVMDRKPGYQMAEDLPLILWQCGFNSTEFDWRTDNAPRKGDVNESLTTFLDHNGRERQPVDLHENFRKLFLEMNETYTEYRLKTLVLKHHLASFAFHAPPLPRTPSPEPIASSAGTDAPPSRLRPASPSRSAAPGVRTSFTPLGAGRTAKTTSFIPLLQRKRGELPETLNARWAAGRGAQRMKRRKDNQDESDKTREVNLKIKAEAFELAQRLEKEKREALGLVQRAEEKLRLDDGSGAATPEKGES
ncbi:pseudouridine synthase DEG1 [Rhodotorula paludigena]|uniref:pseudouridine synthase DEG1 n=1 Tax=Rhodotorula paludigena TaxID=86838 RepID=UPI00316B87E4